MIEQDVWLQANRRLLAKTIRECTYEEWIPLDRVDERRCRLDLDSGVTYRFEDRGTPWPGPDVAPESVTRDRQPATSAVQFFLDARHELGLDGAALGNLVREIQNTLYSETRRLDRLAGHDAETIVDLPARERETLYDGHPKFLADKGRIGWGRRELARFAPEAGNPFPLRYVALDRDRVTAVSADHVSEADLIEGGIGEDRPELAERMRAAGVSHDTHVVAPVHPWQFDRFIATQYAEEIAADRVADLGTLGDRYLPRLSIRTLANVDRPEKPDVKLAVTILNTSCYRGVPGEHLATGVRLSDWLRRIARKDPVLSDRVVVLEELAGLHYPHPRQSRIDGTPYRYNEMLGAVWREPLGARLDEGQQGMLLAALMQTDADGRALVAEIVDRADLSVEAWLRRLFEVTTVPLYHLMCRYGVGLICHGQNVGLVLEDGRPVRGVIKDVHGDLRLVDRPFPELGTLDDDLRDAVKRLPPEHLFLDLVTSHLVTTLRFVSPLVEEQLGLPQSRFYGILADTVRDYRDRTPDLSERHDTFDMLADRFERIIINNVRLDGGYPDRSERPLPDLVSPMDNPLVQEGSA